MANLDERDPTTLVITRKTGQAVWIGGEIRVEVELVRGQVRLRITADRSVSIVREELRTKS